MNAMSFITQRRSVRRYKPDPVPEEVLEQLLTAAVSAPTGGNMQPWEFVIVADGAAREAVVATTYSGYYSGPGNPQAWLQEAPLLIVVCCNFKRTRARYGPAGQKWASLDVAAAIQNLLLASHSMGLGACWVGGFHQESLADILQLPAGVEPLAIVSVGYPAEEPQPKPRLPLAYVTHRNRFIQPYFTP
ncbi:MAG: nitroreductase family protein [bacterium]